MTTLTILRGLPGSGKTTRARELVADDPRCARVNRDDLRMMMFGAKANLTPAQERAVTLAEHAMARALLPNWNVVTDDMNLRPRYVRDWLSIAAQRGADVVMVEMPTPLDECIDRDAQRDAPVSADVIRRIAAKFLPGGRFLPIPDDPPSPAVPQYTQTGHLPPAVIVDIDGTLALKGDRSPYDMTRVVPFSLAWEKVAIANAKRAALRHGWLPPLAWDDDTIDDPAASPAVPEDDTDIDPIAVARAIAGDPSPTMTRRERAEAVRQMHESGLTAQQVGERLQVAPGDF